jgi:hypothetical protein
MINHISTQTSRWMSVYGSSQKPYISPGSMSAGMVRYNSGSATLEVYDGNAWLALSGSAEVGLSPEAQQVLDWAYKKMKEDEQLEVLMEKHFKSKFLIEFKHMNPKCVKKYNETNIKTKSLNFTTA